MNEYILPLILLVAVFVVFGLVHGNYRGRSCGDCSDECEKESCENR